MGFRRKFQKIAPISQQNKKFFEGCFHQNVFCYFPPNRNELPHWLNSSSINLTPSFKIDKRMSGKLNKPIYVESSIEENKSWILDVFLDSMMDFVVTAIPGESQINVVPNVNNIKNQIEFFHKLSLTGV